MSGWTQYSAVELCRRIEVICPRFGCHVALTGGTLYKDGERKDADILFYRIRQVTKIDVWGLMAALATQLDVVLGDDFGWCFKATHEGRAIDFFFPERHGVTAPGYGSPQSIVEASALKPVEPEIVF